MSVATTGQTEKKRLEALIADVRAAIVETLVEIDRITLQTNPQIEADYALKIGCWENELIKAQLEARRAKRKAELAQMSANAGKAIDEAQCEDALDAEFAEWELQVKHSLEAYVKTMERRQGQRAMTPAESNELKRLHRVLTKRLHPDLHPNLDDTTKTMFFIAQKAYENGNLDTLKSLEVATSSLEETTNAFPETEEEALVELEVSKAHLAVLEERLEELKATKPYTLNELLADSEWVSSKVIELKERIEAQRTAKKRYDARFKEIVEEATS